MERIVHNVISIEKPKHIQVSVLKGSIGVNGRNGVNGKDGRDGRDGINGKDGGVFIPNLKDGKIHWELEEKVTTYPSPISIFNNVDKITNADIYSIVNGE